MARERFACDRRNTQAWDAALCCSSPGLRLACVGLVLLSWLFEAGPELHAEARRNRTPVATNTSSRGTRTIFRLI
jgi:hypothetical protein